MADILSIGSAGLSAYRRSLEVTGNNITNVNTEGYARRDAQLIGVGEATTSPTLLRSDSGSGVTVDLVRRATNTFLQAETRSAQAKATQNVAFSDRLDRLEKAVFSSESDLGTYVQGFFEKVQDLASNPTSMPVRITVLGAASQLADRFQTLARTLNTESNSILADATDQLAEANALTQQIAQVNKSLESGGMGAQKSNDLLDRRDTLIDRLVQIVGVTVEENPSGSVNIYIGEGTGGAELVTPNGAKSLAVSKSGSTINLIVDPYGKAASVGAMSGGSLAGVIAYNDQVVTSIDQVNRLATGLSTAFNRQHMAGIDLNGDSGKKMFSTDSLEPLPSPTNRGRSSASIDVGSANLIQNGTYIARFDAAKASWIVTAKPSGETAQGAPSVLIDGLMLKFSGEPADGDSFTFQPLKDAAQGFHLLIDDATQIAAGLPQLAQAGMANEGSAYLTLSGVQTELAPPSIASMLDVFSQSLSPAHALGLRRDGVVAAIPSGAENVTLLSFGNVSAANFVSDSRFQVPGDVLGASSPTLSITVDGVTRSISLFPDGVPADSAGGDDPMGQLVAEINRALDDDYDANSGVAGKVFASSVDGILTLNALGSHAISAASFLDGAKKLSDGLIETASTPADIEIMTREGRQLARMPLTSQEAAALLTEANGFMGEAAYRDTDATAGYRNISIIKTVNPLAVEIDGSTSASVSVLAFPEADTASRSSGSNPLAGGVYVMAVDGLSSIRLAGNSIAGKGTEGINTLLIDGLNKVASLKSFDGATLSMASDLRAASFTVTVDGVENVVHFVRGVTQNNTVLDTGAFTIDGNSGLSAAIVDGKVRLTLPRNLSSAAPVVSFSGSDAAIMGFAGDQTQRLQASGAVSIDLPSESRTITVSLGGSSYDVTISGETGRDDISGVSWSTVSGKLVLTAAISSPALTIVSNDVEARDAAAALGFKGTDLTLSVTQQLKASGKIGVDLATSSQTITVQIGGEDYDITLSANSGSDEASGVSWAVTNGKLVLTAAQSSPALSLVTKTAERLNAATALGYKGDDLLAKGVVGSFKLTSTVTDRPAATALIDTSLSVSRVGQSLTIEGPIPEDLIIATKAQSGGSRMLAARFNADMKRVIPTMPDVDIKITAAGQIEIYDHATGVTVATRKFQDGVPVTYMGSSFIFKGNAEANDTFSISTDPDRTGDNRNGLLLAELQTKDALGPNSGTFQEIYSVEIAKLGATSQAATTATESSKSLALNLQAAFAEATGVNLDTEAAELLKFQQAYQACAQVISTARDLFDAILRAM